jgi:hypothetical protein
VIILAAVLEKQLLLLPPPIAPNLLNLAGDQQFHVHLLYREAPIKGISLPLSGTTMIPTTHKPNNILATVHVHKNVSQFLTLAKNLGPHQPHSFRYLETLKPASLKATATLVGYNDVEIHLG